MTPRPLAGRRVIELGTMIAAPFATHILANLGAEVIKVEPPSGDTTRALVRGGPSGTFLAYNHSKQSLCLDLTQPEGLEVFQRLVATADILIHNLSPAATRKLRITRDDLAAFNPELIYCHIRGYAHGPQHDDLATNPVAEAQTGAMDDHRVNGRPSRFGPSYHDQFAGCFAVIRVLAALLARDLTPEQRYFEIGLYETGLHVAGRDYAGVQLKTQLLGRPEKEGGGEFSSPGYGAYLTADGRWVYLLVLTDAHWAKLTRALSMPEAGDESLARLRDRKKQRDRCEAAVVAAMAKVSFADCERLLREAGLGFTEVLPVERVLEAPQARQPGKLNAFDYRGYHFDVPELPGQDALAAATPPPELGEHSLALLAALGFDPAASAALLAQGAVAAAGENAQPFAWAPVRDKPAG
ncbi:MAG: CoA transferase [Sphingomonadales bacterium]|nr:CoA transferase [Sphingomonadales bacterium]